MKFHLLAPALLFAVVGAAAEPVTMKYNGTLGEALQRIAQRGGISLMTSGGDLSQNVHINLNAADPSAALESLAQAHDLEVIHKGDVFVVRSRQAKSPATGVSRSPSPSAPPQLPEVWVHPDLLDIPQHFGRGRKNIIIFPRGMSSPHDETNNDIPDEQNQDISVTLGAADETDTASASADGIAGSNDNKDTIVIPAHKVVDDVIAYGRTIILEEGVVVRGDAVALLGGNIIIKRGVVVQGDVVTLGGTITRAPDSKVTGKIEQFNWNVFNNFKNRFTSKSDQYNDLISGENQNSRTPKSRYAAYLLTFAALFGIGFLLWMLIPNRMQRLGASVRDEPLRNAVTGVLALFAAAPISVILLVSIIGIPVAFFLWSVMFLIAITGLVVIASEVGRIIPLFRSRTSQAIILAKGIAVMLIIFHIPIVGALIFSMLIAIAIGAAIRTRYGTLNQGAPILDASPIGTPS